MIMCMCTHIIIRCIIYAIHNKRYYCYYYYCGRKISFLFGDGYIYAVVEKPRRTTAAVVLRLRRRRRRAATKSLGIINLHQRPRGRPPCVRHRRVSRVAATGHRLL